MAMRFPLGQIEDFEGSQLVLEMDSVFSAPRLLQDGQLAPTGHARGTFTVRRRDGKPVTAAVRRHMLDPIPQLIIQGKIVRAVESFRVWEWALILLPLLLAAVDTLGTLIGAVAFWFNARLLRMDRPLAQRVALAVAVMIGSGLLYGLIRLIFPAG